MAKTTPKNKKPATAVRCKPTQLDRIEETAGTFHHTVTTALRNFDKRITEQGKVLDSICGSLALDMGDRLKSHADMLHKIQSDLSLMKSGASFMQELRPATEAEIAEHEAKLKAKEEEQKLALLTFGTRVEYEGDKGWKVAMDMPSPDGTYAIVKEGHARMGWTKASQLTIID